MKLFQTAIQTEECATAEFHSRTPDNLLRVEHGRGGGIVIRAAKDNFDSAQRRTFVRYLKGEGFIPRESRLVLVGGEADAVPVAGQTSWVCDPCWPYAAARFNAYTRRLCWRLLLGPTIAWLLFMWLVAFR